MKKQNKNFLMWIFLFGIISTLIGSCTYQEIGDADYPNQKIYMPSAIDGIYLVNDTNSTSGIFRYELDLVNNKLIIPLGVYRSGINNNGNVTVDVKINNDTVNRLITSGSAIDDNGANLELIPASAYTITSSAIIQSGDGNAKITLSVDLDYIASQANKRLALGVEISSSLLEVDASKHLTVLELNTNFIVPTAKFKYIVDKKDDKKLIFYNLSSYATKCVWDFGDGNSITSQKDTVFHSFSDYTTYNVKLTVTGISGKPVIRTIPIRIWENTTSLYIKNPGNEFDRSDARTSLVGNLADWITTDNLKVLSSGVLYGGFLRDYKKGDVVYKGLMDFYKKDALIDGKIYQTITLPAGNYRLTSIILDMLGKNDCYFAVVEGTEFPNASQMGETSVISNLFFDSMGSEELELFFDLDTQKTVTIGFVVNTETAPKGEMNEVLIQSVGLYK